MRTYLCLYLFAPVINHYLNDINLKNRAYLIVSLLFISVYMGTLAGADPALSDGKNLGNFVLLYVLGNTLHVYEYVWRAWSQRNIFLVWIVLNILLVVVYNMCIDNIIGKALFKASFPYNSPILIVNAIIFLMLIAKKSFKSKLVNYLGASALSIYLLHCTPFFIFDAVGAVVKPLMNFVPNTYLYFLSIVVLAAFISLFCISIDKILSPVWHWFSRMGEQIEDAIRTKVDSMMLASQKRGI